MKRFRLVRSATKTAVIATRGVVSLIVGSGLVVFAFGCLSTSVTNNGNGESIRYASVDATALMFLYAIPGSDEVARTLKAGDDRPCVTLVGRRVTVGLGQTCPPSP